MPTSCRRALARLIVGAFAAFLGVAAARAQFRIVHTPDRPLQESETNFFASWSGGERIHGVVIDLPAGWSLVSAEIIREGYAPIPSRIRSLNGSRYAVLGAEDIRTPHDFVFRVRVGSSMGSDRVAFIPVLNSGGRLALREGLRTERVLRPMERFSSPDNFVFAFEGGQPLLLRASRVPGLSMRKDFSVSLWFKTTKLGEVLLSTWNGDEKQAYPLELIVDRAGKLRCFRGRPGEHQSLGSKTPVADGAWHRIVVTNAAEAGWMRLSLDGKVVDSLYSASPLPISMGLPLAVGGRAPGRNSYFDGLRAYSAFLDDLRIAAADERELRLDFEERLAPDLLQEPVRGGRRERSDLEFRQPIREFQATAGLTGIALSWEASDPSVAEFSIERSHDGRSFVPVISVPAEAGGEGRYRANDSVSGERVVYYRVRQKYRGGGERLSATIKVGMGVEQPESVVLVGNFPNPFNATTTITYEVRESEQINVSVWDLSGQQVATLVDRVQSPGTYDVQFAAADLPSGTYFVRLQTRSSTTSHKMILMK